MKRCIRSLQHPAVKQVVRLRGKRNARREAGLVVVEGVNLLRELLPTVLCELLFVREDFEVPEEWQRLPTALVSSAVMRKISDCESPSGVLALLAMPKSEAAEMFRANRLLVLDGVAEPGNIGTLLRSAVAFGWEGAYLLEGCCDPFNPKAVRAAKGATFRLPLTSGDRDLFVRQFPHRIYVAELWGSRVADVDVEEPFALVLGSEANGLRETWGEAIPVTVPMVGEMESLNVAVAGSILMAQLSGASGQRR